jgi:predicted TIM-barrel fold metal-dependent hydrolase
MIQRRAFIKGATMAALATTTSGLSIGVSEAQQVPNSSGTDLPKIKAPAGACDCHMHIFDAARFPPPEPNRPTTSGATVADYRLLQKRLGTTRNIVVTPRNSGNEVTLDAITQFAPNARGVAVVAMSITDAEMKRLNDGGIRGHRFDLNDPNAAITADMIDSFSKRAADLGWHLQLFMNGDKVLQFADLLRRLPTQIVLDHMGQPPLPAGTDHPSHRIVLELLDKGRTWVKLSNIPSNSKIGPPSYPEATKTAQALIKAAPERLVWGTDWPHPGERDHKPNDAQLFDLWSEWAPNEATRNRILVDNPATLYGFAKSA